MVIFWLWKNLFLELENDLDLFDGNLELVYDVQWPSLVFITM